MVKLPFRKEFLWPVFFLVLLDQLTKYLVVLYTPVIDAGIVLIHLVENTGAGFGILRGNTLILGFISLLVVIGVLLYYPKIPAAKPYQILWGMFLAGVIGNMLDRLFRGYVIDFIDLGWWPTFNIADASITVAVLGILLLSWQEERKKHNTQKNTVKPHR